MLRLTLVAAVLQGASAFSGTATDGAFSIGARSTRNSARGRSRERSTPSTVDEAEDNTPAEKAAELAGGSKRSDTRGYVPPFYSHWLGDGYCDQGAYNTLENEWDKGDCCQHTCKDATYKCDDYRARMDCKAAVHTAQELAQVKQELATLTGAYDAMFPEPPKDPAAASTFASCHRTCKAAWLPSYNSCLEGCTTPAYTGSGSYYGSSLGNNCMCSFLLMSNLRNCDETCASSENLSKTRHYQCQEHICECNKCGNCRVSRGLDSKLKSELEDICLKDKDGLAEAYTQAPLLGFPMEIDESYCKSFTPGKGNDGY